jgi:hypothetical protein
MHTVPKSLSLSRAEVKWEYQSRGIGMFIPYSTLKPCTLSQNLSWQRNVYTIQYSQTMHTVPKILSLYRAGVKWEYQSRGIGMFVPYSTLKPCTLSHKFFLWLVHEWGGNTCLVAYERLYHILGHHFYCTHCPKILMALEWSYHCVLSNQAHCPKNYHYSQTMHTVPNILSLACVGVRWEYLSRGIWTFIPYCILGHHFYCTHCPKILVAWECLYHTVLSNHAYCPKNSFFVSCRSEVGIPVSWYRNDNTIYYNIIFYSTHCPKNSCGIGIFIP